MENSDKSNKRAGASGGATSNEKGRKFEDDVAALYRLLGAEVVQNIEICQKKVDILASFPIQGSPTKHHVIVECKDEVKAVDANQRVMQFHGLLNLARKTGAADSADIITRVPWGDAAKGFAHETGINLLTYTEKISQLINFKSYLNNLVDNYKYGYTKLYDNLEDEDSPKPKDPPLGSYYVGLRAESTDFGGVRAINNVDAYVHRWLREKSSRKQLAFFGAFGAGKTSFCKKLAHDMAKAYLENPHSTRIPILLNLNEFVGTIKMEAFVTSFLDQECRVINPRFELFKAMNEAGLFLLIFDGLDEMAVKVDSETLELNLKEIEKLVDLPRSKAILTSRPEHFISDEEERKVIKPGFGLFRPRSVEYEAINILPWEEDQIDLFLKQRVPLIIEAEKSWQYYKYIIKKTEKLYDLSQRPVLLEMIVKTLPKLIANKDVVNLPNLYQTYLNGEFDRQKLLKGRKLLLSDQVRLELLQTLAIDLFTGAISELTFTEALKRVQKAVAPPRHELEAYTREFLTTSFLIRKGESYLFSHKSIMEYLISKELARQIDQRSSNLLGRYLLPRVICDFLADFQLNQSILWDWIETTKKSMRTGPYLGGNAVALLCSSSKDILKGKDLSDTNLTGADLTGVDLRETTLHRTVLTGARLVGAKFYKTNIKQSFVSETWLSFHIEKEATAEDTARARTLADRFNVEFWYEKNLNGKTDITIARPVKSFDDAESFMAHLNNLFDAPVSLYQRVADGLNTIS